MDQFSFKYINNRFTPNPLYSVQTAATLSHYASYIPVPKYSSKRARFIRKGVVVMLIVAIALENLLVPLAYAQEVAPPTGEIEKAEISTLMTDTETAPDMPFIGEARGVKSVIPAMADFASANSSAGFVVPARVRKLAKENYRPNEEIAIVIENGVDKEYKTELIDAIGNKVAVNTEEVETGAAKVLLIEQPSSFRPGKYTLHITDDQGGSSAQDFTWGVLAVNPDKSVYTPNETANLAIGVLDEGGNMVCDAQVELQITPPGGKMQSLSTDNGKIIINEECKSHDFTLKPDYETNYKVGGAGVYKMLLKAQTKNGAYSISDAFEVRNSVPFDVKRVTATRIYPPNAYPVTMEITANQDFDGTITETVPASFRIAPQGTEIKTDSQKVEEQIASDSAQKSATPAPVQAPDNLPKAIPALAAPGVITYNTINNIQESLGGPQVLGASIPGLGMPFSGPFPISQEFGESLVTDKHDHGLYESFGMSGHDGMDFAMPEGTPIIAVDSGKVLFAGDGDYGITVVIEHSWGRSYYGHLSSVAVKDGQEVGRGSAIAASGNTGISTGPHLHFGVKPKDPNSENGFYGKVDPAYYLGLKQSAGQVLGVAASLASAPAFKGEGDSESFNQTVETDVKVLTWKVNVKKGDKITIGYSYLAPRISPQFYTLGPATFTETAGQEVFHETRKWQIASDALEYKFKRGSFTKSTCTAPCTQQVAGVGFKGKAVIFEWTLQTAATISSNVGTDGQHMGTGFATSSTQERAVEIFSKDNAADSDSCRIRSDTKVIIMMATDCVTAGHLAAADFVSFDNDGFTLNWTTNNSSAYIIHYTVVGGADVSNAKAGTFTLTTGSTAELAVTDPGFQPDFVMAMGTGTEAVNAKADTAKMSIGYAASGAKQAALTTLIEDASAAADTCSRHRTDAFITMYTPDGTGTATCGAQDALIYFTKFDPTGFTLNKNDAPAANNDIFYLALQGGMYDVGSITQPTSPGESSTTIGFRPTGVSLASSGNTTTGFTAGSGLSLGGASRENNVPWCNDTTGVACTAQGATITSTQNTDWCNDTTGVTCNSSWTTRKRVSFNNTASSTDLTNFPVLVKLNSSRIDYSKTKNNGEDIRFVDPNDPTVVLPHEIESWNESGDSFVWVKVPTVTGGVNSDYIWMYYNNSSASDGQDVTNVWESNFKAVYHMDDNPSTSNCSTNKEICDSTTNANNGDSNGTMTSGDLVTGQIGNSIDFDGTDDYFNVAHAASLQNATNMTFSAWVNHQDGLSGDYITIFEKGLNDASDSYSFQIYQGGANDEAIFEFNDAATGTSTLISDTSNTLVRSTWQQVTVVYDDTNNLISFYRNGTLVDSGAAALSLNTTYTSPLYIGRQNAGASHIYLGKMDEVRITGTARSADWVRAEYLTSSDNMNSFGNEVTYNQGTTTSSGWSERKKITFNNSASAENLTNFPVLVKLNSSRIDYNKTQNSGQDIRFVDPSDPNTVLSHEIESWNESGDSFVWVKVPQLDAASSTDHIWMYYGNSSASNGEDVAGVWSNSFQAVYHMDTTSGTTIVDSTTNANNGTKTGTTDPDPTTGAINGAQLHEGDSDDQIPVNDHNSLDLSTYGTVSGWFNRDSATTWDAIVAKGNANSGSAHNYALDIDSATDQVQFILGNGTSSQIVTGTTVYTNLSNNYSVAGTWDGSNVRVYSNGVQEASTAQTVAPSGNASQLFIGEFGGNVDYFHGMLDEIRISNVTRSADWIEAEYLSGTDAMNTFGTAETQASSAQNMTEGSIWGGDTDSLVTMNANMATSLTKAIQLYAYPSGTASPTTAAAEADMQSFDPNGFTLNWTTADANARIITYWAVGSVTASQEDYRWYKNANSITPGSALEDENSSTIIAKNKPYARLRANVAAGGNGLNASTQGYKLQYAAAGAEASVGGVSDWCNDTTGVTCTAPTTGTAPSETSTDWCNDTTGVTCTSDWSARRKVTFNNSGATSSVTNFPVLIKLDSKRIDYSKTQNSGQDIRFVDPSDPTVVLDHEIESWDEAGTSYVWVEVPQLDANSTTDSIWMYYGNSSITDGQNPTGTWNSNYNIVYHMDEPSGNLSDSAGTAQDAARGGTSVTQTTGKVGSAQDFSGTGYTSTSTPSLPTGDFTYETWVYADTVTDETVFMSSDGAAVSAVSEIRMYINSGIEFSVDGDGTPIADFLPTASTWDHYMMTRSGSTVTFYKNGIATPNTNSIGTTLNFLLDSDGVTQCELFLGVDIDSNCNGSLGNYLDGRIDEFRVSNTARSADWAFVSYKSQNDQLTSFSGEFSKNEVSQASTGWGYRKQITFNNSASAENLMDFPVLVKLDNSKIDYSKTQDDGGDIRFVDPSDPNTVLSHEIESWNEGGNSFVWVKVPQIDSGSTSDYIYMYYGNPGVADGQNATGVWDSNFKMVHHLEENPALANCVTDKEICDSTTNANNGDMNGAMTSGDQVTGKIGGSMDLDGSNDYFSVPNSASLGITGDITMSAWVKRTSTSRVDVLFAKTNGTNYDYDFFICDNGGNCGINNKNNRLGFYSDNTTELFGNNQIIDTSWHNVAFARSGSAWSIYIDGVLDASGTEGTAFSNNAFSLLIGYEGTGLTLSGGLDEIKLSNTGRSADWIEAEYKSQSDQLNMFGQEQPYTSGGTTTAGWTDVADVWCNDASGVTCNTSWSNRKRITFDNQSSSTALTNFPVLVKLDSSRIDYTKTQDDGDDLRFVDPADPTTVLSHEIETWNESGESLVWVEVPSLDAKSASDSVWMYYGNASVGSGQDVSGVWDGNFNIVYHMDETSGTSIADSAGTAQNGTKLSSTEPAVFSNGKLNGAQDFDGTNDDVRTASPNMPTGDFTYQTWVNLDTLTAESMFMATDGAGANEFYFGVGTNTTPGALRIGVNGVSANSTHIMAAGSWYHVTITRSGSNVTAYVNGVPDVTLTEGTAFTFSTCSLMIGVDVDSLCEGSLGEWLDGRMDEIRVSNTARSADWVRAEYLSTADQMNTFGNEETQSSAAWRFKDNSSVSDRTTITTGVLGTSTSGNQMTYQESNITSLNPTALAVGEKREFDFSLDGTNTSSRRTYYFRIVTASGEPLTTYTRYPSITVGVPNQKVMRGGKFFNYKAVQPFSF